MSEMLDNPDEHGIYPTSKFMWEMETLILAENERLQKQSDLLTLGLLQEKDKVQKLINALDCAKNFIDGYGAARIKEGLGRDGMDAVFNKIGEIAGLTDICLICGEEKLVDDLHRNCGK